MAESDLRASARSDGRAAAFLDVDFAQARRDTAGRAPSPGGAARSIAAAPRRVSQNLPAAAAARPDRSAGRSSVLQAGRHTRPVRWRRRRKTAARRAVRRPPADPQGQVPLSASGGELRPSMAGIGAAVNGRLRSTGWLRDAADWTDGSGTLTAVVFSLLYSNIHMIKLLEVVTLQLTSASVTSYQISE